MKVEKGILTTSAGALASIRCGWVSWSSKIAEAVFVVHRAGIVVVNARRQTAMMLCDDADFEILRRIPVQHACSSHRRHRSWKPILLVLAVPAVRWWTA